MYDVQDVGMLSEATIDKQLDSIVEEVDGFDTSVSTIGKQLDSIVEEVDGLDTSVDTFETLFCFVLIALFLRAILN